MSVVVNSRFWPKAGGEDEGEYEYRFAEYEQDPGTALELNAGKDW